MEKFVVIKEVENVAHGMGDSIPFTWFAVWYGRPDPYAGPSAKFKLEPDATLYAAIRNALNGAS